MRMRLRHSVLVWLHPQYNYDVAVSCYFCLDLAESKHKSHVLFRCGLNSTIAELHGNVTGSCKVWTRNDVTMT